MATNKKSTSSTASAANSASEVASSITLVDLIPLPIVYSSFLVASTSSSSNQLQVTRLSTAASSRLLPGGALDYESKAKRMNFVAESPHAAKMMDSLFITDRQQDRKEANLVPEDVVDSDSVVVRVLYSGGFTDGSFDEFGQHLPRAKPGSQEARLHSRLQHFASSSCANSSPNWTNNKKLRSETNNVNNMNPPSADDDPFSLIGTHSTTTTTPSLSFPSTTSTPGLTFVGKVVAAGKNVHFSNEWVPDPEPTSIIPRGLKEGDLVCGIQCDKSWLRGAPLRGSAASYIVVPACFVMRIDDIRSAATASSFVPRSNASVMTNTSMTTTLLSTLAANLLPAVLWHNLLRWHVDPKKDESILFVCVRSNSQGEEDGNADHRAATQCSVSVAPSSTSSLIPAIGAVLCSAFNYFAACFRRQEEEEVEEDDREERRGDHREKNATTTNTQRISIVSTCEEDTKFLRRFDEFVRMNSGFVGDDDREQSSYRLFDVVEVFESDVKNRQHFFLRKFHHVIVCHDGFDENHNSSGKSADDDEVEDAGDDENQQQQRAAADDLFLPTFLFRSLRENGTIGYIKNQVVQHSAPTTASSSFLARTLLPIALSKNGRLAFMTTQSLFDSPPERIRRSLVEICALLVSGDLALPPPSRIVKPPDQQKNLDPLIRQYKMFLLAPPPQQQQQQQNQHQNKANAVFGSGDQIVVTASSSSSLQWSGARQVEWSNFADRFGLVVAEMLNKSLVGLASLMTNRRKRRKQEGDQQKAVFEDEGNYFSSPSPFSVDDAKSQQQRSFSYGGETTSANSIPLLRLSVAVSNNLSSDVAFENGLNSLVIQLPGF